jgi:hypothetical protein
MFVLVIALSAGFVNAACSRPAEEKAAADAKPAPAKEGPATAAAVEVAPAPEEPARIADAGVPEAVGPVGSVPEALRGVWENIDPPFRGMRVEFADAAGMAAIRVVAPPFDDAQAVAFHTAKHGNRQEIGVKFAACMPKIWAAGVTQYSGLRPTARPDAWVGSIEKRLFEISACREAGTGRQDVVLRLKSKDELVAIAIDAKTKVGRVENWKRVAP